MTGRFPFTDPIRDTECVLVIPPGGQVYPAAPGDPKIGVEHLGRLVSRASSSRTSRWTWTPSIAGCVGGTGGSAAGGLWT